MPSLVVGQPFEVVLTNDEQKIVAYAQMVQMTQSGFGDVSISLELMPRALPGGHTLTVERLEKKTSGIASKHFPEA